MSLLCYANFDPLNILSSIYKESDKISTKVHLKNAFKNNICESLISQIKPHAIVN